MPPEVEPIPAGSGLGPGDADPSSLAFSSFPTTSYLVQISLEWFAEEVNSSKRELTYQEAGKQPNSAIQQAEAQLSKMDKHEKVVSKWFFEK